jgi:hypothetical protein
MGTGRFVTDFFVLFAADMLLIPEIDGIRTSVVRSPSGPGPHIAIHSIKFSLQGPISRVGDALESALPSSKQAPEKSGRARMVRRLSFWDKGLA